MAAIHIVIFFLLLILTSFFVISEFAIVRVRRPRIEYLAAQGKKRALAVQRILEDLNSYLSASQLGVTLTALAMGWVGEPTAGAMIDALFENISLPPKVVATGSAIVAFLLITYLNVVLGELAPKTFAIQRTERTALLIARPLILFHRVLFPFIWILNSSANLVTRVFGINPAEEDEMVHSEEELRLILSESYHGGEINQSEYRYVNKIFDFDDRMAKEVMVPRTEIVALYKDESMQENLEIMRSKKLFTRYPVAEGDKDHIVGLVNIKELLNERLNGNAQMENYIRPIITVIETIKVKQLLVKMQKERIHMAVLMDEYGGTAGLVTVEDILEEIVGEIRDEFDVDEKPMIQQQGSGRTVLDGKVLISDVNQLFGLNIDDSELDTIGGWMLTQKPEVEPGTVVELENYRFQVKEMEGRQVKEVEVSIIK
ncbi:MAG TPA: hemolysin family protein [Bacillales bacterium]|nr:hemolysin family protein [Bacillales bacterium]